jgi:hypothetical protein
MKIKITLFALLLSLISFGQDREYEIVNTNYKNQNYTEAIAIGEKLLQNQYGSVSPLLKMFTTYLVADSYKLLNKYPEALNKYKDYLALLNTSTIYRKKDLEKAIIQIQKLIDELQLKSQNNPRAEAKPQPNETTAESSSNKTTTLVVTGQGKTKNEAQQNALRNAIEQAFGAFISSKTEVLNDSLVKDEIVSVSNGNIQKFEEVSETILQNNDFSVTLKATVSITKLTSFVESKGWEVEFKGALFGANLRQQKLNEEAEFKAILNLCEVSNEILSNSLDYSLETKEPTLANQSNLYQISITVKAATNANFKKFSDYFSSTIKSICMTTDEVANYNSLNKKVYTLLLGNEKLSFRSPKTSIAIQNLFIKSNQYLHNFIVASNIGNIPLKTCCSDYFNGGSTINIDGEYPGQLHRWRLNVPKDDFDENTNSEARSARNNNIGFPNFTCEETRYKRSSWRTYYEYLYWLKNNSILFDKLYYFTGTGSFYKENGNTAHSSWPEYPFISWPGPSQVHNNSIQFIGELSYNPGMYYSKYIATYTEEEIMKITGFTVKKLN